MATGNRLADAIIADAGYLAAGPADPTPYVAKITDYATRLAGQVPAGGPLIIPVETLPANPQAANVLDYPNVGTTFPGTNFPEPQAHTLVTAILAAVSGGYAKLENGAHVAPNGDLEGGEVSIDPTQLAGCPLATLVILAAGGLFGPAGGGDWPAQLPVTL